MELEHAIQREWIQSGYPGIDTEWISRYIYREWISRCRYIVHSQVWIQSGYPGIYI